jgi:transcription initiation factor TFIID subunit 4
MVRPATAAGAAKQITVTQTSQTIRTPAQIKQISAAAAVHNSNSNSAIATPNNVTVLNNNSNSNSSSTAISNNNNNLNINIISTSTTPSSSTTITSNKSITTKSQNASAAKNKTTKSADDAGKKAANFQSSFYNNQISSMYGDDDINDVAAMGGVNLAEETQRILGSTEYVGTQIRSCKDEVFLSLPALQSKIRAIVAKHGLEEPSQEVSVLISHACQERLKNIAEKLAVIAEHRMDVIKVRENTINFFSGSYFLKM